MFAASPFVEVHYLEGEGFGDREEARQQYFEKVKVSYMIPLSNIPSHIVLHHLNSTSADCSDGE